MGLLSQLFVEIGGDDAPLSKTLADVRGSLAGVGNDAGGAGRSISQGLGAGIGGDLAAQIRTAMGQALKPLEGLATTMVGQFDRIGGTVITSARRIDAKVKFEGILAALDKVEAKIPSSFGRGAIGAIRSLMKVRSFLGSLGDVARKSLSGHGFGGVSQKIRGSYNSLALNISGIGPAARASTAAVSGLHGGLIRVLGIGSLFGGIGLGISKAIHGASDLNETLNKTEVIFGPGAEAVKKGADQMARDFGIVKTEFMDMGSTFGSILQGMGGASKESSAETSVQLAKLAADASSIFNKSFGEASSAIASALRGQSEPISAFSIDCQEAAVKQEALRLGLVKGTQELSTQAKVTARASLIMKGLRVAQGDLEATQGGFANASRAAWGRVTNILASAGQAFMPVVEKMLGGLNRFLGGIQSWVDRNKGLIDSWAETVQGVFDYVGWLAGELASAVSASFGRVNDELAHQTGTLTPLGDAFAWVKEKAVGAFETMGVIGRNWSNIMSYTGVMIRQKLINVGETFTWLMGAAGTFGGYLANNWVALLTDACGRAWTIFSNLGKNIGDLFAAAWDAIQGKGFHFQFTPLLEGFKATAEKLPEIAGPVYTSLQKELDAIVDNMAGDELKRIERNAEAAKAALGKKDAPTASARPGAAPRDAEADTSKNKATTTDLAGYFKQLQEGAFGKGNPAERTAKAAEETARNTRVIKEHKDPGPQPALAV